MSAAIDPALARPSHRAAGRFAAGSGYPRGTAESLGRTLNCSESVSRSGRFRRFQARLRTSRAEARIARGITGAGQTDLWQSKPGKLEKRHGDTHFRPGGINRSCCPRGDRGSGRPLAGSRSRSSGVGMANYARQHASWMSLKTRCSRNGTVLIVLAISDRGALMSSRLRCSTPALRLHEQRAGWLAPERANRGLCRCVRRHYAVVVLGVLIVVLRTDCIAGTRLGLGKREIVFVVPLRELRAPRPIGVAALVVC